LEYNKHGIVQIHKTILNSFINIKTYWNSVRQIKAIVNKYQPDCIVNFYEPLGGLYNLMYGKPCLPMICIGHQYLLLNQYFPMLSTHYIDRCLLNAYTYLTSLGATKRLALSFDSLPNDTLRKIVVVPPLLRWEVKQLIAINEPFYLAYITQVKLASHIIQWQKQNPSVEIHCFWNNPNYGEVWQCQFNLTFHQINGQKYLDMMRRCSGLISTAGFESICEAFWLGKPALLVPVPNHIEQRINAFDGQKVGAGIAHESFDISTLLNYKASHIDQSDGFRAWQQTAEESFLRELVGADALPVGSL
jgi:uncharacterized protein (TIGR00661 family)